ncbi:MAG: ABC transporter ATP-binding protein [Campylobacter sp.]|nr:ABC transporter ATP-binding protein [Campylobacter sp.]
MEPIITARNLMLSYENDVIIKGANLDIKPNDFIFITGKSGSGKSTLLKSFYGDISPKMGELKVCMTSLNDISDKNLNILRQKVGIIFQNYRLINEWNVEKNVMLPLIIKGISHGVSKAQVAKLLKHVNMLHKADKYPLELSGGEQQRVAMARALAHNPLLLLCDEPTGNLDEYSSEVIWSLLRSAKEFLGTTIVVVTHHVPSTLRIDYRRLLIENGEINELV